MTTKINVHVFMGYDHHPPWKLHRKDIKPWMLRNVALLDACDQHSLNTIGWRANYNDIYHYYLFMSLDKYTGKDLEKVTKYMKRNA